MSKNDQITEDTKDIEALLNRTFALEILVAIMMRDLLSPESVGRILDSLRQQAVYPPITAPNVVPLHKHSAEISLAVEQLHEDLAKVFLRSPSS